MVVILQPERFSVHAIETSEDGPLLEIKCVECGNWISMMRGASIATIVQMLKIHDSKAHTNS